MAKEQKECPHCGLAQPASTTVCRGCGAEWSISTNELGMKVSIGIGIVLIIVFGIAGCKSGVGPGIVGMVVGALIGAWLVKTFGTNHSASR